MAAKVKCLVFGLVVVVAVSLVAGEAQAQCATCGVPTVAYYQPAPVAYTSYYRTGWYPGYWLDRANYAVWGRPRYAASYATYYQPSYSVGYAPVSYGYGSGCSSCGTGCATCASYAPACSSCASYSPCGGCTTCARPVTLTSAVVLRPVCGCDPCGCSSCGTGCSGCASCDSCPSCTPATVTPASYTVPAQAPCTDCAINTQAAPPTGPAPNSYSAPQQPQQPTLAPSENPPTERTFLKEPANGGSMQPTPATESSDPSNENSAGYMEAPQLFNPSDRTAERVAAPVWNAVYHKTASADAGQQLEADAAGWTSVSN